MTTPSNRYLAEITVKIRFPLESTSTDAAQAEARRLATERQGIAPSCIDNVWVTPLTRSDVLSGDNLRAWQELAALKACGSPSQIRRWEGGTLPEDELLDMVRTTLFRPLGLFGRRTRMGFTAIDHPRTRGIATCLTVPRASGPVKHPDELVAWRTIPNPALTDSEHRTLRAINEAAAEIRQHPWLQQCSPASLAAGAVMPELVGVAPREHEGQCKVCSRATFERSALVTVHWAGRNLSREYTL